MKNDTAAAKTLNGSIADVIREKILLGEFRPGQRLSEASLSETLSISRNTLREAFRLLSQEGLLRHEPNRGVSVATPSVTAIIDIYRARRLIECQALLQAYPHHPALVPMRDAVEKAQRFQAEKNWQEVGTCNMEFHMAVVQLADSERISHMFAHMMAEMRLAFCSLPPEPLHAPYVEQNATILALIEARKFAEAASTMQEYLAVAERSVLATYSRHAGEGA